MRRKLDQVQFDFNQFTVEKWLSALGDQFNTRIVAVPMSMPDSMFGAWVSQIRPSCQFIFYDSSLQPEHQAHTILHECAHWLCGHTTLVIDRARLHELIQQMDRGMPTNQVWELLARRSSSGDRRDRLDEAEAEVLALLIQDRAAKHHRWTQFSTVGASHSELRDLLAGLGLLD